MPNLIINYNKLLNYNIIYSTSSTWYYVRLGGNQRCVVVAVIQLAVSRLHPEIVDVLR